MSKVATCLVLVGKMPVYSSSIKVYCKGPGSQKFLPIISPNLQLLTALLQPGCDLVYKKNADFQFLTLGEPRINLGRMVNRLKS